MHSDVLGDEVTLLISIQRHDHPVGERAECRDRHDQQPPPDEQEHFLVEH